MARQLQLYYWLVNVVLVVSNMQGCVHGHGKRQRQHQQEQVPCYFIFGDSFSANGNDNGLDTFKSNYLPYGIDFPDGPTGRFSNGRTMVDIIAQNIGIKDYIPPYRKVGTDSKMLKGVNYASSGAVMQKEIAGSKINSISLGQQVKHHQRIIRRMGNILRNKNKTDNYLQSCLYTVGIGSNDYMLDYYIPNNNGSEPARRQPSEKYAEYLVNDFLFSRLFSLYRSGARKVVLFGLPPLGCSPAAVRIYGTNQNCVSVIETDTHIYNTKLRALVDRLNKGLNGAKFTYINIYDITSQQVYPGFKNKQRPCCETDYNGMCYPKATSCSSKKDYFYWDGYHPTEAANIVLANHAYNASVPSLAYPYNIHQLISTTKTV